ncbi:MAG TPA: MFS transporter [Anaerolineae bacterium]|nr:MFS transporter [Anaerolineae bacterium]
MQNPQPEISDLRSPAPTDLPGEIEPLHAEPAPPVRKGAFRALSHRNYRLFFFGQLISVIGTWMQDTALKLLVVRLVANPAQAAAWLGAVSFIPLIPLLPVALIGGSLVDRFPRRRLVLLTQSTMMVQALLLFALTASGVVTVWHILLLSVLSSIANAIDVPARQTLVSEMVEGNRDDLGGAIALNSSIFNLGRAVGPAIAGVIVAVVGEADAFLVNALSFIAVLIGLLLMRLPPRHIEKPPKLGQHLKAGFNYLRNERTILILMSMIATVAFLAMPFTQMLPLFATYTLADSAQPLTAFVCARMACVTPEALTLGLLNACFGIGALTGALLVASQSAERGRGKMLTTGNIAFPLILLCFALSRSLWLSFGLLFLVGIGWVLQTSLTNTLLQLTAPDHVRGRVMSVYSILFQGMWRIGSMGTGFLAALAGPPFAVGLGAALALAYGVFAALRWPRVRKLA